MAAAASLPALAQQTMSDFSICDIAAVSMQGATNVTLAALTDKNDLTEFEAPAPADGAPVSIVLRLPERWVVTGIVLVAGASVEAAPVSFTVSAQTADGTWTELFTSAGNEYAGGPYTSVAVKGGSSFTEGSSVLRVDFSAITSGTAMRLADMQLLGYPADNAYNLATEANGAFTAPASASNLEAVTKGNVTRTLTLRNVKANDGVENAWVEYAFNEPTAIAGYGINFPHTRYNTSRPTTWDLLASEDGESWVTLDMRNNEQGFPVDFYSLRYNLPSAGVDIDYAEMADKVEDMMIKNFYRDYWDGKYLVASWNEDASKVRTDYNYWWMAHTVDAFTDIFLRTKLRTWSARAGVIKKGMYVAYDAGRRDLWNSYYDDMEWMAIACIRAYENYPNGNDKWLEEAKQLFDWIWGGWNYDNGSEGGIRWNSGSGTGKNSCSNAPAIISAARLYTITGDEEYLTKAKMIHDWMLTHSRFDDGFIKDSPGNDNRGWTFSYNQGTWVGGLLELYKITKDEKYRETAVDLMDKSLDGRWFSPDGIMREQGDGDGGLFKGIYIRYITEWVLSGELDPERQYRYSKYLVENAKSLCLDALVKPLYKVMPCWKSRAAKYNGGNNGAPNGNYDSSILLSGIFLLEGVDRMRREGVINDDYTVPNPNIGKPYKYYRLRVTDNRGASNLAINGFQLYGTPIAGIEGVAPDTGNDVFDASAPVEYFTLSGMSLGAEPTAAGIYIRRQGAHAEKFVVR